MNLISFIGLFAILLSCCLAYYPVEDQLPPPAMFNRVEIFIPVNGDFGENDEVYLCHNNDQCELGGYCHKDTCDGLGLCQALPLWMKCDNTWLDPVCGCDGVSYVNPCFAAVAGVTIDFQGGCPPKTCYDNTECETCEFCNQDYTCGDDQQQGTCQKRGEVELCRYFATKPVCGCDGKTYENECYAYALGVSIASYNGCRFTSSSSSSSSSGSSSSSSSSSSDDSDDDEHSTSSTTSYPFRTSTTTTTPFTTSSSSDPTDRTSRSTSTGSRSSTSGSSSDSSDRSSRSTSTGSRSSTGSSSDSSDRTSRSSRSTSTGSRSSTSGSSSDSSDRTSKSFSTSSTDADTPKKRGY